MNMQSESIAALAKALSAAQGEIKGALKDAINPAFSKADRVSKYADLAAVLDAAREPLKKNGLAVIQTTFSDANRTVHLRTTLAHESGEWIQGDYPIVPVQNTPQGYGSAITYARRYCFAAAVGIAQIDDDANEASGKPANETKAEKPWHGPMNKTALKQAMRELWREMEGCTDQSELDGVLENYKKGLDQCRIDLPEIWDGDGGDVEGIRKKIARLEAQFAQEKAA